MANPPSEVKRPTKKAAARKAVKPVKASTPKTPAPKPGSVTGRRLSEAIEGRQFSAHARHVLDRAKAIAPIPTGTTLPRISSSSLLFAMEAGSFAPWTKLVRETPAYQAALNVYLRG